MPKQYTVQAPDGKTITLEGPDGASPEDVIKQAQSLYPRGGQPMDVPPAMDIVPIEKRREASKAAFEANLPKSLMDRVSEYLPSPRTAFQVGGATIGGALGTPAGGPLGTVAGGALGAGTGEALYEAVQRFRGAGDVPTTSNESLGRVGSAMSGGALQEGMGIALPAAGQKLAERLYRTTLKPSTTLTAKEATAVTKNLLSERIPVSPAGMRKLDSTVKGLNQQVVDEIASVPGAEISPNAVASRVDPSIANFGYKDLQKDLAAASGEKARFLAEHSTSTQFSPFPPPHQPSLSFPVQPQTYLRENPIPAPRAQSMKAGVWNELSPNDFGTVPAGYKQARKNIGSGIRAELEAAIDPATGGQAFPNIKELNAREGRLLEAKPELQRAVNRTENKDIIGIGGPIVGGAVEAATGNPILAAIAAITKNSGSRTAILLDRLSRSPLAKLPKFGVIPAQRALSEANQ